MAARRLSYPAASHVLAFSMLVNALIVTWEDRWQGLEAKAAKRSESPGVVQYGIHGHWPYHGTPFSKLINSYKSNLWDKTKRHE